jgi:hypothetical protein
VKFSATDRTTRPCGTSVYLTLVRLSVAGAILRPMARRRTPPDANLDGVSPEAGLHLHWEGRRLYRARVPVPRVLEPDKRLSLGSDGENLVIEGDNL